MRCLLQRRRFKGERRPQYVSLGDELAVAAADAVADAAAPTDAGGHLSAARSSAAGLALSRLYRRPASMSLRWRTTTSPITARRLSTRRSSISKQAASTGPTGTPRPLWRYAG